MKHLIRFGIFESSINKPILAIEDFLNKIGLNSANYSVSNDKIINWWKLNRSEIKINFFPFLSSHPIAGVFLGTDEIAINERMQMPPHIKLFLALHESRHCDQHAKGILNPQYYETVVNRDKSSFLRNYQSLEKDANDFAISAMREMGFVREMNFEESKLRTNERMGEMVYNMMSQDIQKYGSVNFVDLLKKQIV